MRIEDTDQSRFVDGAEELIIDTLKWLGLDWNEGPVTAKGEETGIHEAPLSMVIPILVAAGVSVFMGIYPDAIMSFVKVVTG